MTEVPKKAPLILLENGADDPMKETSRCTAVLTPSSQLQRRSDRQIMIDKVIVRKRCQSERKERK